MRGIWNMHENCKWLVWFIYFLKLEMVWAPTISSIYCPSHVRTTINAKKALALLQIAPQKNALSSEIPEIFTIEICIIVKSSSFLPWAVKESTSYPSAAVLKANYAEPYSQLSLSCRF